MANPDKIRLQIEIAVNINQLEDIANYVTFYSQYMSDKIDKTVHSGVKRPSVRKYYSFMKEANIDKFCVKCALTAEEVS